MPLTNESDYAKLAAIYLRRARATLKYDCDEEAAVKDIELASMAHFEMAQSILDQDQKDMQQEVYQQRNGQSLIEPNEPDLTEIHA